MWVTTFFGGTFKYISFVGAQQYDQFGKIFTVKLQYIFYKERPGVRPGQVTKAERITNKLSQFAAYAIQGDYQGVKEFGSDLRKLGLPVEHAPQVRFSFSFSFLYRLVLLVRAELCVRHFRAPRYRSAVPSTCVIICLCWQCGAINVALKVQLLKHGHWWIGACSNLDHKLTECVHFFCGTELTQSRFNGTKSTLTQLLSFIIGSSPLTQLGQDPT